MSARDPVQAKTIDALLARALRGEDARWPPGADEAMALRRIAYHGVAAMLGERLDRLGDWPAAIRSEIRASALAAAMWELRHRDELGAWLRTLASAKIEALVLKGSALAYSLYPNPAVRQRGDSDVLIRDADRAAARSALRECGFFPVPGDELPESFRLQEVWRKLAGDGTAHVIDLHFALLNAPALAGLVGFEAMAARAQMLRSLAPGARAPAAEVLLFHACLHRAVNECAPYFVDGETQFGGDRLIWLFDIHLLVEAMDSAVLDRFVDLAAGTGEGWTCAAALEAARGTLATRIPPGLIERLRPASSAASRYFRHGQWGRALRDLRAVGGLGRRLGYVRARLLPSQRFMRCKYPSMERAPLPLLHLRRMVELMIPRPGAGGGA